MGGIWIETPCSRSQSATWVNIRASVLGQFQLLENLVLLRPVFWISARCKFTKPVTLEIQHCTLREDKAVLSQLRFVSAKCSQKDLTYRFALSDGGVFTTHSSYGSIQLWSWCYWEWGDPTIVLCSIVPHYKADIWLEILPSYHTRPWGPYYFQCMHWLCLCTVLHVTSIYARPSEMQNVKWFPAFVLRVGEAREVFTLNYVHTKQIS